MSGTGQWIDAFWTDLRFAARALRRAPVFAVVVLTTIACGTGVTTAIVALVNLVLLAPLPYPDADRLVVLVNSSRGQPSRSALVSAPRARSWREHAAGIREAAAYALGTTVTLDADGSPPIVAGRATAGFFPLFGASLSRGRPFAEDEDRPGGPPVAVISYGLWQRRFGGADTIIGQPISINGDSVAVIGVLDRSFDPRSLSPAVAASPDVWLPLRLDPETRDDANNLMAVGRLRDGVSTAAARLEARAAADAFRTAFPGELPAEASFDLVPLHAVVVGDVRQSLLMLSGAVALVTLIVCANTANLLLGQAVTRRREMAIRVAVGASRARLIRQMLTESVLLSAGGGLAGGAAGLIGLRLLLRWEAVRLPRMESLRLVDALDVRVLLITTLVVISSGIAFGLVPAATASRSGGGGHPGASRMTESGRRHRRMRAALLMAELSLACMLVTGAGLLIRSLTGLSGVNPGFDRANVLTLQSTWGGSSLTSTAEALRSIRATGRRLSAVPGIESVAVSLTGVPLEQGGALGVQIAGRPSDRQYVQHWDAISPEYFDVFRIRLIRGRRFTERDDRSAPPVVIINEAMARQLWPAGDPLDDRLLIGQGGGPAFEEQAPRAVIGIVADVRQFGLNRPARPGMYVPLAQASDAQTAFFSRAGVSATWALRTRTAASTPGALQGELLRAIGTGARIRTMDEVFDAAIAPMAVNTWLMTAFGGLALLLAVIGIYAIASHGVHQRTHEMGVRLALGARPSHLRNLVVWESLRIVFAGVVIGSILALGLARVMSALLYGVTPHDPLTFTIVPAMLVAAALAGVYGPARRATRVDPLIALRRE